MIVFLNGRFVPETEAMVSVLDRGFLYGDGLFETLRTHGGQPFLWSEHMTRFLRSAGLLRLRVPFSPEELRDTARELLRRNGLTDATLRLALSRGVGIRGYSPRGANEPTFVMTVHPAPAWEAPAPRPWRVVVSRHRVAADEGLNALKHSSRLLNVLARAEAEDAGADEALLLNGTGEVAEAGAANVFWFSGAILHTPPVSAGPLAGVTRGFVLRTAHELGWETRETRAGPEALHAADGCFLTLSSLGVVEVGSLDGIPLRPDPRIGKLRESWLTALQGLLSD